MSAEDIKFYAATHLQYISNSILNSLLDKPLNNTNQEGKIQDECRADLIELCSSSLRHEHWALKVFDSFGRLRSGLMSGSLLNTIGSFEQCSSSKMLGNQTKSMRNCLVELDYTKHVTQLSELTGISTSVLDPVGGRSAKFGLCIPETCNQDDITNLGEQLLANWIQPSLSILKTSCDSPELIGSSINLGLVVTFVALTSFIALCTAATILDTSNTACKRRWKSSRSLSLFVETFSLIRNLHKLLENDRKRTRYKVLDGLRVVSMLWIIIVHSYNFAFQWILFDNPIQVGDIYKSPWTQWIANGTFSVDNFFLISGFLAFQERNGRANMESSSKHSLAWRILRRYLRLAPMLMIMILFSTNLLPYYSYGFNWSNSTLWFGEWCQRNWPYNLLMVQNLISTPTMCFSHSWFIAVDFQLFVLIEIILEFSNWFSDCSNRARKLILLALLSASQIMIASLVYAYKLPSMPLVPADTLEAILNYFSLIYIKPFYWLSSYSIGVLLAMSIKSPLSSTLKRKSLVLRFSLSAFLIPLSIMFALLMAPLWQHRGVSQVSTFHSTIYAFSARPLWSLCTASLLYGLTNGPRLNILARFIDSVLGARFWVPLSRLTFATYLLHPVIMAAFYGSRTQTFIFSHALLLYFTIGNVVLSYTGAFFLYLVIELPIRDGWRRALEVKGVESRFEGKLSDQVEQVELHTGRPR